MPDLAAGFGWAKSHGVGLFLILQARLHFLSGIGSFLAINYAPVQTEPCPRVLAAAESGSIRHGILCGV